MKITTDLIHLYHQLDLYPSDRTLLMAIADEKMDLGSDLGLGLGALAACDRVLWYWKGSMDWGWWNPSWKTRETGAGLLTWDWWRLIDHSKPQSDNKAWDGTPNSGASIAFKRAAEAFYLLPPERQEQLLEGRL